MIKKLQLSFLIAVLSLAVGVQSAHADALTYSADTTVTVGSYNYTILDGSTATQVAVNAADLTVIMPSGSTFTLTSADRKALSTDQAGGFTATCGASVSTIVLHQTSGSPVTFVVAPTGDCTPITGGGGGGGGSGSADTTPPTSISINVNAGAITTSSLSVTVTLGASGATQMIVSNDAGFGGASWESYATTKPWTLTTGDGLKTVYVKFRDAAGNMSSAISDSITVSGTGTVAVVSNEPTQGCSGNNQYNTSTGALCINNTGNNGNQGSTGHGPYNFGTKVLKNGSKGEAVKELQRFLNAKLFLGLVVDGKLGPKTIAVIKKWQKDHGLVVDGLIGPKTKIKMNSEAD
jgi:hypothetical protein